MMEENSSKAPDAFVMFSDGSKKHLSDLWKHQALVLVFVRHFG